MQVFNFVPVVRGTNRLEVRAEGDAHEIVLIGAVGKSWWDETGITEQEFRDALKSIPNGKPITLKINSEGGSVKEGLGIYNAIKERRDSITAKITGYAMSIASVFPLAAGKVISPKSAIWMIHRAWSWAQGNAEDMEQAAEMLEQHDQTLAEIYAQETGKTKKEMLDAMSAETWIRGSKAVEWGLADEGDDGGDDDANALVLSPEFLSRFQNCPQDILAAAKRTAPVMGQFTAPQQGGANQQKEHSMNREQMIALLNKWGVKFDKDASDEALNKLVEAGKPQHQQTQVVNVVTLADFNAEKRRRIRAEIVRRGENKIANDKIEWWVNQAMQDEDEVYSQIDALPQNRVGDEPVGGSIFEGETQTVNGFHGRPTEKAANLFKQNTTPEARWNALKQEWPTLLKDAAAQDARRGTVLAANSFAAGITTNFLIQGAITQLGPQIAPLAAFSRDNTIDPYKPLATGVLKFNTTAQDGSTTLTDPTSWGPTSGDSTLAAPTIAVHQYSEPLYLTNAQLNSGIRMADLIVAKLGSFRAKIASVVLANITKANFGTTAGTTGADVPLVSAFDAFGFSDLAKLQGALQKSTIKNVILDGRYIARISNSPTFFQQAGVVGGMRNAWSAFGWDLIALNSTGWPSAENCYGFACNPQAIGIIAGLPINPPEGIPGNIVQTGVAQLVGPDVAVATYLWFDANSRTLCASYDIMLGSTAVDKTAGVMVVTG